METEGEIRFPVLDSFFFAMEKDKALGASIGAE